MIPFYRRKKKIKQVDMAKAISVSPSYLCRVENGLQKPNEKFMTACADYLEVSFDVLFPARVNKVKIEKVSISYSNKLWSARKERGIKQYELAKSLGCSPSYLSKVEKGLQEPNITFRNKCAKILKIKEVELFS